MYKRKCNNFKKSLLTDKHYNNKFFFVLKNPVPSQNGHTNRNSESGMEKVPALGLPLLFKKENSNYFWLT